MGDVEVYGNVYASTKVSFRTYPYKRLRGKDEGRDNCECHATYVPVDIAELFEVTCIHFLCRD